MDRRKFNRIVLAIPLLGALPALAQPRGGKSRIGVLLAGADSAAPHLMGALRRRLAELGWSEGKNLEFILREAKGDQLRFAPLAAELIALKPDLIFAPFVYMALEVKKLTRDIPVVFAIAPDPVALGLVASLARPGGNATGPAMHGVEIGNKRLQLLKEIVPSARRIGVLLGGTPEQLGPWESQSIKAFESAARQLGLEVINAWAPTADDIGRAIAELARQRVDGFYGWLVFLPQRHTIVQHVNAARLPSAFAAVEYVESGGLMWVGASLEELYRHAASYVDRILRGANPAELPVESPTKIELVINLKTAKALGLKIPPAVLLRADRVIE